MFIYLVAMRGVRRFRGVRGVRGFPLTKSCVLVNVISYLKSKAIIKLKSAEPDVGRSWQGNGNNPNPPDIFAGNKNQKTF